MTDITSPDRTTVEYDALDRLTARRHSTRAFRPDPVPRDVVDKILAIAQRAPSWCNTQPWHVTITRGAETEAFREGLSEHATSQPMVTDFEFPGEYRGEYRNRRREAGIALYSALGITREDRAASGRQMLENFRLFGAPHVAIVTTEEHLGVYGAVDCGLYVQSFLLAAESLGVACIPQAALASHSDFIRRHFDLPDERRVLCGISFGYEDANHAANSFRTSRADLESGVTRRE
ncbi:nitroreductase [Pseudonocardia xishanensis]|uniref:Nitroreductase n=1 Tax=Pseudonocardia xishanensis TaxID=630995 RepID=A0ABP8RP22_9PSEU